MLSSNFVEASWFRHGFDIRIPSVLCTDNRLWKLHRGNRRQFHVRVSIYISIIYGIYNDITICFKFLFSIADAAGIGVMTRNQCAPPLTRWKIARWLTSTRRITRRIQSRPPTATFLLKIMVVAPALQRPSMLAYKVAAGRT